MATVKQLAFSQGFYSRLFSKMCDVRDNDPATFDRVMTFLESKNFKDSVDLVLYFES